ncbi:MAG: hypothetical protein AB7V46_15245 [Thermomicrobiales bacterium]
MSDETVAQLIRTIDGMNAEIASLRVQNANEHAAVKASILELEGKVSRLERTIAEWRGASRLAAFLVGAALGVSMLIVAILGLVVR